MFFLIILLIAFVILKKKKKKTLYIFNPELDGRIQFLLKQFAQKKLTIKEKFPCPKNLNKITPENLEKILDQILSHMKLKKNVFLIYHSVEEENFKNIAGTYDQAKFGYKAINLVIDPKYTMKDYISILAHECAHHFMDVYSFEIKTKTENEKNTDTLAILLGFGKYLARTHKFKIYDTSYKGVIGQHEVGKLGYLLPYEVDYIINKHVEILKNGKAQKKNLKIKVKGEKKVDKLLKTLDLRIIEIKKKYSENKIALNRSISNREKDQIDSKWDLEKVSKLVHKYESENHLLIIEKLKNKIKNDKERNKVIRELNELEDDLIKDSFFIEKYLK